MTCTLILTFRARKELFESWLWYEKQSTGIGDKFEIEVFNRIKQIGKHPDRYPIKRSNLRETRIKKFSFLIIYRIDEDEKRLIIQSIFHTRRNPKLKYRNL